MITSIRVRALIRLSSRVRQPTVSPTDSPSRCAIRRATARAATRRGSSTRYHVIGSQGSSSSRKGTIVVLPGTRFGDEDTKTPIGKGVANVGNDVFDRKPGVGRRMSHEHILLARRGNAPHDAVRVVSSCNVLLTSSMSMSMPRMTADQHVDAVAAHVNRIWPRADGHQLATRFIDAIGGNTCL